MNNGNLDNRILMGKFAIILFRVIYVFVFFLSIVFFIDESYKFY